MYKLFSKSYLFVLLTGSVVFNSCKEKDPIEPTPVTYEVPATYNFPGVDYSGQTTRIQMLDALSAEMRKGNTVGTKVSAQHLKNMFANVGNPFNNPALDNSGKQLKDKTYGPDVQLFESYFDSLAVASQSNVEASHDQAGVVGGKYLISANGIEYTQVILKGLMGATLFNQIANVYLSDAKTGDTVALPRMKHHWDEAFGYFGVPVDFPANKNGLKYWGSYSNQRDAALNSNKTIMDAFLKGRSAIMTGDMATKNAQRTIIISEIEKISAASAIHYLNKVKNATAQADKSHAGSEGIGFVMALKYNANKKISPAQINEVLGLIGQNLYHPDLDKINQAINILSSVYGFDNIKNTL